MNLTNARHQTYPLDGAEGLPTVVSHVPNKALGSARVASF